MKTKKTYTSCRVGLFIGLFSFHTLSSCVNTGRGLGVIENHAKQTGSLSRADIRELEELDKVLRKEYSSPKQIHWYQTRSGMLVLGTLGTVFIGTALTGMALYLSKSNMLSGSGSMVTIPPYISNTTITRDTLHHTANRTDTSNHNDSESSGPFNDPMLLDEEVIAELREANFSKEKVEELITTGRLNVNAMTKEGESFLIYLLGKNIDAFKYLLHLGADPNLITPNGSTALVGAIWGSHKSEFNALLQDPRTDVCPKESDLVLLAASRSGSYFMEELEQARQKCPEEHFKQKRQISNLFIIPKLNEAEKMLREGEKKWGTLPNKTK